MYGVCYCSNKCIDWEEIYFLFNEHSFSTHCTIYSVMPRTGDSSQGSVSDSLKNST